MKKGILSVIFTMSMAISFSSVSFAEKLIEYQTSKAYQFGCLVAKYEIDYEKYEWRTLVDVMDYRGGITNVHIADSVYIHSIDFYGDGQVFMTGYDWSSCSGKSVIFYFDINNSSLVKRINFDYGENISGWQIIAWRNSAILSINKYDSIEPAKRLVKIVDFSTGKVFRVAVFSENTKIFFGTDSDYENFTVLAVNSESKATFYLVTEKNRLSKVKTFSLSKEAEVAFLNSDVDFISLRYNLPKLRYIELE